MNIRECKKARHVVSNPLKIYKTPGVSFFQTSNVLEINYHQPCCSSQRLAWFASIGIFPTQILPCLLTGSVVCILLGDLLKNYCIDDTLVNVSRIGYAFVVMFTFPIEMFVCREVSFKGVSLSHCTRMFRQVFLLTCIQVCVSPFGSLRFFVRYCFSDCLMVLSELVSAGRCCSLPWTSNCCRFRSTRAQHGYTSNILDLMGYKAHP